jgi:alanine racemase
LVCGNDLIAVGAIWAARSLGLRVPDDVSVVGYDGTDFTATCDPPLTTVRQPFGDMAVLIADALVSEIDRSRRFRDIYVFAPELIARGSTGRLLASTATSQRRALS